MKLGKKHLYFVTGIMVIFVGLLLVNAYGGSSPSVMGHSAGEIAGGNFGSGNYSFPDRVGIGTTSPGYPFHVSDDEEGWLSTFQNTNSGGSTVYLARGSGYGANINAGTDASSGTYALNVNKAGTSYLYVRGDGNVGIGTTSPKSKLQVDGYIQLDYGTTTPASGDCDAADETGRMFYEDDANTLWICDGTSGWKSTTVS